MLKLRWEFWWFLVKWRNKGYTFARGKTPFFCAFL